MALGMEAVLAAVVEHGSTGITGGIKIETTASESGDGGLLVGKNSPLGAADNDGTPDDDICAKPGLDAFSGLRKARRERKSHGKMAQRRKVNGKA